MSGPGGWLSRRLGAGAEPRPEPDGFVLARDLFLRGLGLVHAIAHVSLWVQIEGLVGSRGLLPLAPFLEAARAQRGAGAYAALPTLCWLSASDAFLHGLCAAGTVLAIALVLGIAPIPVLLGLWTTYLSLSVAGQDFLYFQWDALLLETTLAALFVAPVVRLARLRSPPPPLRVGKPAGRPPLRVGLWVLWALLFKLMFLSGITKLLSGDPTWRDGSALAFHYETQPLPAWTAWYAHQAPGGFQAFSTFAILAVEIAVPFAIFATRRLRHAAGALLIASQVGIAATGSYGFFNLLAVVLCVPLFDDRLLGRVLPARARTAAVAAARPGPQGWVRRVVSGAAVALVLLSGVTLLREMTRTARPEAVPRWLGAALAGADAWLVEPAQAALLAPLAPFRSLNGYGLFRVMTTERPEIEIQGTADGERWQAYAFRWKPGDVTRRPRFAAPYMPRLDWQMWFAALDPPRQERWLGSLAEALLRGEPRVLGLLGGNPFPGDPPRAVRFVVYRYHFTDPASREATGAWWRREPLGRSEPMELREDSPRRARR